MPIRRIRFNNFNRRLVLAGGQEQTGPGGVRQAVNVAPESTTSILSRWGSQSLRNGIAAIQAYYWNGVDYLYDGTTLYASGSSLNATIHANGNIPSGGFNGNRITFVSMPPSPGLPDYLFVLGGGCIPFKIDPSGNVTNWGIQPPDTLTGTTGMQAANVAAESTAIEPDNWDSGTGWKATNAVLSDNSDSPTGAAYSLEINPGATAEAGQIVNPKTVPYSPALNLSTYADGTLSLPTDVFQFWLLIHLPATQATTWAEVDFDVNDGSFKKDWYSFQIGFVSPTGQNQTKTPSHTYNTLLNFQSDQWQLITIPKSAFLRNGASLQYDWSNVQAIRFRFGNPVPPSGYYLLDNSFTMSGGCAMGAGPAVGNGGSEYDYFAVFRNQTTGAQSNPQPVAAKVFGVQDNTVKVIGIPVSSDAQVTARDLYRTQALTGQPGGGVAFYLDTIPDNTTTTYTDSVADQSIPLTQTPWQKNVSVPPNSSAPYYVDGGNGYYFRLITGGTTGAAEPSWVVPSTVWSPQTSFAVNDTTSQPKANGHFWKCTTAGISGSSEPDWTKAGPLTDGTAVWTDQGVQQTNDNGVVWRFMGINSTAVLGQPIAAGVSPQLLYDNTPPASTYDDAIGNFQGSMFWTRDSASGKGGYLYVSPPGRPEAAATAILACDQNDPAQKLVGWDSALWLLSQGRGFQVTGTYPNFIAQEVNFNCGTLAPWAVVALQKLGILYWAPDGVRVMNWSGSTLLGFEQLATIFRGQPEENIANAWNGQKGSSPIWAALLRDEVVFSDGANLTLALAYEGTRQGPAWRQISPVLTALYYAPQVGKAIGAFGGNSYWYETSGQGEDGSTPITFTLQTAGDFPAPGEQFTFQRLYISANLNQNQTLSPSLIIDGEATALPSITGALGITRTIYELSPKLTGRMLSGVIVTGNLTGRVEIFDISADVWFGEVAAAMPPESALQAMPKLQAPASRGDAPMPPDMVARQDLPPPFPKVANAPAPPDMGSKPSLPPPFPGSTAAPAPSDTGPNAAKPPPYPSSNSAPMPPESNQLLPSR